MCADKKWTNEIGELSTQFCSMSFLARMLIALIIIGHVTDVASVDEFLAGDQNLVGEECRAGRRHLNNTS